MKGYESWSFFNRPFLAALVLSALWHFLWVATLNVTVESKRFDPRKRPEIVSLGPVLDDSMIRTLVESRPRYSEAFYRHLSDLSRTVEPEVRTSGRRAPGEVVSFSMGQRLFDSLRAAVGGSKFEPDGQRDAAGDGPEIGGEAASRTLLYRPSVPETRAHAYLGLTRQPLEIAFEISPAGAVVSAEIAGSSGDPETDLLYVRYLKEWRFSPSGSAAVMKGKVRFDPRSDPETGT
ncbi:MAG: hypothetical protein MOGMAGMI_01275 [Candidatus Omnitrophica bacterium]|nr:hypothetical protein [Candidatus Omnitrophota bacterium]